MPQLSSVVITTFLTRTLALPQRVAHVITGFLATKVGRIPTNKQLGEDASLPGLHFYLLTSFWLL